MGHSLQPEPGLAGQVKALLTRGGCGASAKRCGIGTGYMHSDSEVARRQHEL